MNVVLASLVLGARLPSGDVVRPSLAGFALAYEGAPPASFAELAGAWGRPDPVGGASSQTSVVLLRDVRRPQDPMCREGVLSAPRCEGPDGGSESTRYIATTDDGPIVFRQEFRAGIGGQVYRTPSPVRSILIEDANGAGVPVRVFQYQEDQMVRVMFCSHGVPFDLSSYGFEAGYFWAGVATMSHWCPTAGTTGTITITW